MVIGFFALIAAIIAAFNPDLVWVFVILVGLYELYALFMSVRKAPLLKDEIAHKLTLNELEMWKRYPTFLTYPFASRMMSSGLSTLQFISLALGIVLLFRGEPVWGVVIALNYFLAAPMAMKLNPQFFFHNQSQKGDAEASSNLENITTALQKLHNIEPQEGIDADTQNSESNKTTRKWKDVA